MSLSRRCLDILLQTLHAVLLASNWPREILGAFSAVKVASFKLAFMGKLLSVAIGAKIMSRPLKLLRASSMREMAKSFFLIFSLLFMAYLKKYLKALRIPTNRYLSIKVHIEIRIIVCWGPGILEKEAKTAARNPPPRASQRGDPAGPFSPSFNV